MTHPAVDDVQVINVKDERLGDEICAWVKLKQEYSSPAAAASDEGDETRKLVTKQDILSHCKGKIAHYKIPRYVRFVDSFPLTVTGKQQKFIMRNVTNDIIKNNLEEL
jgi:fatty-acyl-CoA synthase